MVLAELHPAAAAAAKPATPCMSSCQDSVAQEPYDSLASLLSGEDPWQSSEPLAWDPDKLLQRSKLEAGQTRLHLPFAENIPQFCPPMDTGTRCYPSSIVGTRPPVRCGASPATRTGALHPICQLQHRHQSDGFAVQCASQAADESASLSHDAYASLLEVNNGEVPWPLRPVRTATASTNASACSMPGDIAHLIHARQAANRCMSSYVLLRLYIQMQALIGNVGVFSFKPHGAYSFWLLQKFWVGYFIPPFMVFSSCGQPAGACSSNAQPKESLPSSVV